MRPAKIPNRVPVDRQFVGGAVGEHRPRPGCGVPFDVQIVKLQCPFVDVRPRYISLDHQRRVEVGLRLDVGVGPADSTVVARLSAGTVAW